jgi:tetratricopeptide (TPR) repeat protein
MVLTDTVDRKIMAGYTLSMAKCMRRSSFGDRIVLIENHDEAYYIWRDAGISRRVVLHIDAHHDMWWIDRESTICIANFICPAIKQGLLREVFWIVPDATFQNSKTKKAVFQHLKQISEQYPGKWTCVAEDYRIIASVLGKKVTICPLRFLPPLHEPVLLDIDVDYLLIPRVSYGKVDQYSPLPWCWPDELVAKLRDAHIRSDLVTVAYSVEGGYTPVEWKYLGDELALLLKHPNGRDSEVAGMFCIRKGAEAEQRGEVVVAESMYRQAQVLLPRSAAVQYRLARLLVNQGRVEVGKQLYAQAVSFDGSYRSAYTSGGFHWYLQGEFKAAEREFRNWLMLNSSDAYSHLGLGLLAQKRKCWSEAEQHLRNALLFDDCALDAQRALGHVMTELGRTKEAIFAYEQALRLGLSGHKPLEGPILTNPVGRPLLDPWHFTTQGHLARLYAKEGATQKAIDWLRISIAGGLESADLRLRLARLYWRQGQWREFIAQCWRAIRLLPSEFYSSCRRHLQRAVALAASPRSFGSAWKARCARDPVG